MSTLSLNTGATAIAITYAVKLTIENDPPDHTDIRFPGMNGAIVQQGGRRYNRIGVSAWLTDTSQRTLHAALESLAARLAAALGRSTDKLTVTHTDGTSTDYTRVRAVGTMRTGRMFRYGSLFGCEIEFTVEVVRSGD